MTRVFAVMTMVLLCGCQQQQQPEVKLPFTQDAYIWQRVWNDSLRAAMREAAPQVHVWRVLVGEVDARGDVTNVKVDWETLRASRRPVIAVVRTKSLILARVFGRLAGGEWD